MVKEIMLRTLSNLNNTAVLVCSHHILRKIPFAVTDRRQTAPLRSLAPHVSHCETKCG